MHALTTLSPLQKELCNKFISPHTFYMLVGDALDRGEALSAVRMADGEAHFMRSFVSADPDALIEGPEGNSQAWLERYGVVGLTNGMLENRLKLAAEECTHFCPSMTGIYNFSYCLFQFFKPRDRYVDNFFVNSWDETMKINLYKKAERVIFIHRNRSTADALQIRAKWGLGLRIDYIELSSWQDADRVVDQASKIDAPLVIFSAGPASKWIGPMIANGAGGGRKKVTLDLGNAADYWTLLSLKDVKRQG